MRTEKDIRDHFAFPLHQPGSEPDIKAILHAMGQLTEWLSAAAPGLARRSPFGEEVYVASHAEADKLLLALALTIFRRMPEVPDRTAALRSLHLCRAALHAVLQSHRTELWDEVGQRLMWANGHLDDALSIAVDGVAIAYNNTRNVPA